MVSRQPGATRLLHDDPHQRKVVFGASIGFAILGEDCNGQGPGQEDDETLESMNIVFAFLLQENWNFHGSGLTMVICSNRSQWAWSFI